MPRNQGTSPPTSADRGAPPITDQAVAAVFDACPSEVRKRLIDLRALIFSTAARIEGVGAIEETLKWGQPSYVTTETKSGTTIRIDAVREGPRRVAVYVHCQTNLVERFRERYGAELAFEGNRAIVLDATLPLPVDPLRHCIAMALTYHRDRRTGLRATRGA